MLQVFFNLLSLMVWWGSGDASPTSPFLKPPLTTLSDYIFEINEKCYKFF